MRACSRSLAFPILKTCHTVNASTQTMPGLHAGALPAQQEAALSTNVLTSRSQAERCSWVLPATGP